MAWARRPTAPSPPLLNASPVPPPLPPPSVPDVVSSSPVRISSPQLTHPLDGLNREHVPGRERALVLERVFYQRREGWMSQEGSMEGNGSNCTRAGFEGAPILTCRNRGGQRI